MAFLLLTNNLLFNTFNSSKSKFLSFQTLWDVPEELIKKYPGHFLEEDKEVFRKVKNHIFRSGPSTVFSIIG
jgi:hypothetical protein